MSSMEARILLVGKSVVKKRAVFIFDCAARPQPLQQLALLFCGGAVVLNELLHERIALSAFLVIAENNQLIPDLETGLAHYASWPLQRNADRHVISRISTCITAVRQCWT